MKNLLLFELRKLSRAKSFYICAGISFVMLLLSIALIFAGIAVAEAEATQMGLDMTKVQEIVDSKSANDLMFSALSSSSFVTLIGIFVAIFLCDDFSQGTIKNVYSHGFSRSQVFFTKMIAILIATTAAFIAMLVFAFLMGLVFFGKVGEFYNPVLYLEQYLYILSYMAFVAFITFAFRKIALSIVFLLFAPGIFGMLLSLFDLVIGSETFKLANFWFGNFELMITAQETVKNIVIVLVGSVLYTALFTTLGWVVSKKRDL